VKDGMDISLVALSRSSKKLQWSGANNSLWIIRNGELLEWKADKQPVGMYFDRKEFTTHTIEIESNDLVYVFSDGFGDQFGGEKKKKFKESSMKKLLLESCHLTMDEQKKILENEFMNWKGDLEQIDDVCVIGVKI
jgi:serine phosphatase RsbU (regulator of sigma subunit)